MKLVHWKRSGRSMTRAHIVTETLSNTEGRTGCGRRYPRRDAIYREVEPDEAISHITDICRSCLRAYRSEPLS